MSFTSSSSLFSSKNKIQKTQKEAQSRAFPQSSNNNILNNIPAHNSPFSNPFTETFTKPFVCQNPVSNNQPNLFSIMNSFEKHPPSKNIFATTNNAFQTTSNNPFNSQSPKSLFSSNNYLFQKPTNNQSNITSKKDNNLEIDNTNCSKSIQNSVKKQFPFAPKQDFKIGEQKQSSQQIFQRNPISNSIRQTSPQKNKQCDKKKLQNNQRNIQEVFAPKKQKNESAFSNILQKDQFRLLQTNTQNEEKFKIQKKQQKQVQEQRQRLSIKNLSQSIRNHLLEKKEGNIQIDVDFISRRLLQHQIGRLRKQIQSNKDLNQKYSDKINEIKGEIQIFIKQINENSQDSETKYPCKPYQRGDQNKKSNAGLENPASFQYSQYLNKMEFLRQLYSRHNNLVYQNDLLQNKRQFLRSSHNNYSNKNQKVQQNQQKQLQYKEKIDQLCANIQLERKKYKFLSKSKDSKAGTQKQNSPHKQDGSTHSTLVGKKYQKKTQQSKIGLYVLTCIVSILLTYLLVNDYIVR